MPPERKVTPGMRGGRQRSSVRTVLCAIVAGSDLAFARPRREGRTSGVNIDLWPHPFIPDTVPTCPELSSRCLCTRVLRGNSVEQSMPSGGLVRALNSGHGHRGLQQRALEQHAVVPKLTVHLADFIESSFRSQASPAEQPTQQVGGNTVLQGCSKSVASLPNP